MWRPILGQIARSKTQHTLLRSSVIRQSRNKKKNHLMIPTTSSISRPDDDETNIFRRRRGSHVKLIAAHTRSDPRGAPRRSDDINVDVLCKIGAAWSITKQRQSVCRVIGERPPRLSPPAPAGIPTDSRSLRRAIDPNQVVAERCSSVNPGLANTRFYCLPGEPN
jgi:hypothetical protein